MASPLPSGDSGSNNAVEDSQDLDAGVNGQPVAPPSASSPAAALSAPMLPSKDSSTSALGVTTTTPPLNLGLEIPAFTTRSADSPSTPRSGSASGSASTRAWTARASPYYISGAGVHAGSSPVKQGPIRRVVPVPRSPRPPPANGNGSAGMYANGNGNGNVHGTGNTFTSGQAARGAAMRGGGSLKRRQMPQSRWGSVGSTTDLPPPRKHPRSTPPDGGDEDDDRLRNGGDDAKADDTSSMAPLQPQPVRRQPLDLTANRIARHAPSPLDLMPRDPPSPVLVPAPPASVPAAPQPFLSSRNGNGNGAGSYIPTLPPPSAAPAPAPAPKPLSPTTTTKPPASASVSGSPPTPKSSAPPAPPPQSNRAKIPLDPVWLEPLKLPISRRASSGRLDEIDRVRGELAVAAAAARGGRYVFDLPEVSGKGDGEDEGEGKAVQERKLSGSSPPAVPVKQGQQHQQLPSQTQQAATRPTPAPTPALAPFSLWEYLREEVLATDFDSTQEMKWERVTNFIAIPWWVEKIILFGFVICLDSFLYTFTILPLRFVVAVSLWLRNTFGSLFGTVTVRRHLHSSHKCDILKTFLVVLSCIMLTQLTDASKMYHAVRGQDVIKLYVIFNVMEILDRLCCSLGQDLLDALFSRATLARRKDASQPVLRPLCFFALALAYIQAHTMILFYQLVALNVAINSYDNALLTLLLSNQFVEIKGSVFKKFEKENLFQMTCADIVERFQLALILFAIGVRNLIEVSGGGGDLGGGVGGPAKASGAVPLPRSFTVFPSISLLETSFAPVAIVLASECLVDWLKHAFITKFNHIRPAVYGRFMDVLCRDLVVGGPMPAAVPVAAVPAPAAASAGGNDGQATAAPAAAVSSEKQPAAVPPTPSIAPAPTPTPAAAQPAPSATTPASGSAAPSTPPPPTSAAPPLRTKRRHTFVDQSPIVSRRLGFAALPLACLLVRISVQIWGMLADDSHFDECAMPAPTAQESLPPNGGGGGGFWPLARVYLSRLWSFPSASAPAPSPSLLQPLAWTLTALLLFACLVALKLLLGASLVSFASARYRTMNLREAEEELNARERLPIGVPAAEREYEARNRAVIMAEAGCEAGGGGGAGGPQGGKGATAGKQGKGGGGGAGSNLMDVNRYTMVKSRLW